MRHQNRRRGHLAHDLIQGLNPLIAHGMIPITLYHPGNVSVLDLPQ